MWSGRMDDNKTSHWRDLAWIFTNGKFYIIGDGFYPREPKRLTGYDSHYEKLTWIGDGGRIMHTAIHSCTLVARKFKDMSEVENEIYKEYCGLVQQTNYGEYRDTVQSFLYLISIGVFPNTYYNFLGLKEDDVEWII